ncbi:hypothetical protein LOZ53_003581 [Ophidiomyces ophidiicola]|nr:hypothetical protein LOZ55_003264 [Ophidiomyces ophidiicola]KAI1980541.1 hypothetical protein LOZ54_005824 [Ophidiomyces ophidiicola]KAI1989521.1 hypothetical protein LOZ53_003581 [Ophidiomyces ophidiicola]KAI1993009.1 hypothetical protein LOZ51_004326 [Ophidiomyces ophidiicola]
MILFSCISVLVAASLGATQKTGHDTVAYKAFAARQALQRCTPSCSVKVGAQHEYRWFPMPISTTIVAATIVKIVNTVKGTTRTSTIYNSLPSGYTLPPTNSDGKQVSTLTYTQQGLAKTTVLTFPTSFVSWPDGYTWSGTLQTKSNNKETCVTASTPVYVPFSSFPQPQATETLSHPAGPDPNGLLFKMKSVVAGFDAYKKEFKDQAALQTCSITPWPAPLVVEPTAQFLSETSTSFEGDQATSSSHSATPPKVTPSAASLSGSPYSILLHLGITAAVSIAAYM